jgi:hypothetical protein
MPLMVSSKRTLWLRFAGTRCGLGIESESFRVSQQAITLTFGLREGLEAFETLVLEHGLVAFVVGVGAPDGLIKLSWRSSPESSFELSSSLWRAGDFSFFFAETVCAILLVGTRADMPAWRGARVGSGIFAKARRRQSAQFGNLPCSHATTSTWQRTLHSASVCSTLPSHYIASNTRAKPSHYKHPAEPPRHGIVESPLSSTDKDRLSLIH